MAEEKTSEAQRRASRNWEKKNPEQARHGRYLRTARLFIRAHATHEELEELRQLMAEREKLLEEEARP